MIENIMKLFKAKVMELIEDDETIKTQLGRAILYAQNDTSCIWIPMDELNNDLNGIKPLDIIRMSFAGNFNPNDNYYRYDGYSNLESSDYEDYDNDVDYKDIDEVNYNDLPSEIQELYDEMETYQSLLEDFEELEDFDIEDRKKIKDGIKDLANEIRYYC